MTDALEETWEGWVARIGADLTALTEDDWMTFTVHVASRASSAYAGTRPPRRWRRSGSRPGGRTRVPDVFVQVRRLGALLALECIGDTEFEGLTDLSREQQSALADLGWQRQGKEPEFSRALTDGREAAALLRSTLADVLGAATPADVDVRRAPRP